MECSSIFFPIRVKEEVNNESTYHDAQPATMPGYYSAASQYFPQMIPMPLPPPPPSTTNTTSVSIKQESMLTSPDNHHHHHPHHHSHHHNSSSSTLDRHLNLTPGGSPGKSENGEIESSTSSSPPGNGVGASPIRPPLPPLTMAGFYNTNSPSSSSAAQQHSTLDTSSTSSKYKRKKKKKVKEEPNNQVPTPLPSVANSTAISKKHLKQEKITDAFKVRKKVDRFNGMPEEEVIKRTLPDHLAPDLDILIIGINPGLFAAFKGHHYAGPGNHFWKCLYLSGLIPDPMTADDDYKLIELGIGFTNIVARTTKGSADLNRKEIREGAQVLQEKIQRYRPKIAVFNGKGIYEVFSGRKNFDFGKQPEPIEGTNSTIYVMPSSSARCAQLPRAVDKVPFYVALKKLRDHICGRLPILRDSEVCFPDVKLKMETDDGLEADILSDGEEPSSRQGVVNLSANSDGTYSVNRAALPPTQRNFHQHPLGRAALAAAAAAGGYLDETLARAGLTRSGESLDGGPRGSLARKYKCKKKKLKDENCDSGDDGSRRTMEDLHNVVKKIKTEKDDRQGQLSENEVKMENVQHFSEDYHRLQTQGGLCPPPIQRPNPQGPGTYGVTYPTQFPPSPSSEHSPLYGSPLGPSPYQHPHIKQEKMDLLDPIRVTSPSSVASSSSLLGPYSTSVGCLYGPSNPITGGYGPPQATYYGAAGGNPYGAYHPSFGPPSPFSPQLSPMNPHHPLNQLSAGTSSQVSSQGTDLFGSGVMRENGFHHPTARHPHHHHLHPAVSTQHPMSTHDSQYYSTASMASTSLTPYTSHHPKEESPTSSLTAPGAFHQYPSPPASSPSPSPTTSGSTGSYNHLLTHQTHPPHPMAHQYCPTPSETTGGGGGPNFDSSPPMYANLENVKVKQERMDSSYGDY